MGALGALGIGIYLPFLGAPTGSFPAGNILAPGIGGAAGYRTFHGPGLLAAYASWLFAKLTIFLIRIIILILHDLAFLGL